LPIWAFHGADDNTVLLKASATMVDAVRKCGGHVQFTVYPDYGHDICDITYRNRRLYDWLLAQRRSRPSIEKEGDRQ
jgi:dipeptidyl aminopeptidase/acylaminoacyl peptidase